MLLNEDQNSPELLPDSIHSLIKECPEQVVQHLREMLGKRSPEVRLAAVGALGRIPSGIASLREQLEIEKNELVLSEVCEILGYAKDDLSLPKLKALAADHKSSIVRSYAIIAVADIAGHNEAPFMRLLLKNCRSRRLRASLNFSLILAGDWARLESLLGGLVSRDYVVRYRVAHFLAEKVFREHRGVCIPALSDALEKEEIEGVAKAMRSAIAALSESAT